LDKPEDLVPFLPPRPPRFRPGDRPEGVNGWVLHELLGVGGFGEVWLARDGDGRQAALKFCLDPAAADGLRPEKALLDRVQNHHGGPTGLVRLLYPPLDADPPCLVFEYVPGGDLTRLIRCWHESHPSPARLAWESLRLVGRLAEIVGVAHRLEPAVVHRDLKPSNILLQPAGENRVWVRVADFGIGGLAAPPAMAPTASARGARAPRACVGRAQTEGGSPARPAGRLHRPGGHRQQAPRRRHACRPAGGDARRAARAAGPRRCDSSPGKLSDRGARGPARRRGSG